MPIFRAPPRAIAGTAVTLTDDQTVDGYKVHSTGRTGTRSIVAMTIGDGGEIEVRGVGTGAAVMTLHRPGSLGTYFGLDTDNKLKWGGWSQGAVAKELLDRTHIIGTVAANGTTGAILERGNNANGYYIRYADGTQICWYTHGAGYAANSAFGQLWFSGTGASLTPTFPIAFAAVPTVMVNTNDFSVGPSFAIQDTKPTTTIAGRMYVVGVSSGVVGSLAYIAVGRWY